MNYVTWQLNRPTLTEMPDIRFNAGKALTRAEAVDMITKVFDDSKRVVFDELTFANDNIDDYGYNYGFKKRTGSEPNDVSTVLYYHVGKTITYRIDELWQLLYMKYDLPQRKVSRYPTQLSFECNYGAIFTSNWIYPLYDGTL